MRKLCSKWELHLLTVDQKQQRIYDSERCLQLFQLNKKDFLRKYATMDETPLHSSRWKSSKATKEANINWQGILFIDYLEKGRTINSEYHVALMVHLKEEITETRPQMKKKKKNSFTKTMHRVTSRSQRWQKYMTCTSNCFRPHPVLQYLAPSDNWLFAHLERTLQGNRYGSNGEDISGTEVYFEVKDKSFYIKGIEL